MTVRERPSDVVVLREHELARWLQRHPVTLTPEQVQHIAAVAAQPAAWKRMAEAELVDHAAFDRLHRDIRRASRLRMRSAGALLAALPLVAWVTCSAAISAISG